MTQAKQFSYLVGDQFGSPLDEQITNFLKDTVGALHVSTSYTVVETNKGLLYSALLIYTV